MQFLSGGQCVADLEVTGIRQTYDIASESLIYRLFLLRHEARRRSETHLLVLAHVIIIGVPQELAAAYLEECDTAPVVRIHIRVDLETERRELVLHRLYCTLFSGHGARTRGVLHKEIQQLLYTNGFVRRTEENGCQLASQVRLFVELRIYAVHHL